MACPFTKSASLTIAVSKGRVAKQFIELLAKAGYDCTHHSGRSLLDTDVSGAVRLIYAKSSDVLTYVQQGVSDLGVVGSDLLLELSPRVYELGELPIGRCRLCIAGKPQTDRNNQVEGREGLKNWENQENPEVSRGEILRIATKYPVLAKKYLQTRGIQGEIFLLNGSVELGPLLGLSDVILDIVETGRTLVENGLEVHETLTEISTRIVANKAYYKTKYPLYVDFMSRMAKAVALQKGETSCSG